MVTILVNMILNTIIDNNKTVIVDKQSYLGLVFTPSGRFTYARAELCKKAIKNVSYIRSLLSNCTNISISIFLKLF